LAILALDYKTRFIYPILETVLCWR